MLLDPLDQILATRGKVRLLRALLPLDRPVSGREAARLAGVSRQAIGALDELTAAGVVNRQELTGQHLYTFNHRNILAPVIGKLFNGERQRTAELFDYLENVITEAGGAVSAVVFGSSARAEAGADSDLDILVLAENPESEDAIYSALTNSSGEFAERFGVQISPVVITVHRARHQRAEGDAFIATVVQEGRSIYGAPLEEILRG